MNDIKVTVGFDGYVDRLIRIVRKRENTGVYSYFKTIGEFASGVGHAAGKSADWEIITQEVRFGGNAPIMANALSVLGIPSIFIGAADHEIFKNLKCRFISICKPAETMAFEFDDGKIMLAETSVLRELNAETIMPVLTDCILDCSLFAFTGWSNVIGIEEVYAGLLERLRPESTKIFFDLADCSKRSHADITRILEIIRAYSERSFDTYLGMNLNEYEILNRETGNIYAYLGKCKTAVHLTDRCHVQKGGAVEYCKGKTVEKPVLTTGGGDNFNAGFCFGLLSGMSLRDAAVTGMRVSEFYVRYGHSPSLTELEEDKCHF